MGEESPIDEKGGRLINSRYKPILSEGAWVVVGQGTSALALLIGTRVLTEYVTPAVFGLVSLLLGFVVLGSNLFCLPHLQAAVRFLPEVRVKQRIHELRSITSKTLSTNVAILGVLILVIGTYFSISQGTSPFLPILLAALLIGDTIRSYQTALLGASRQQKLSALWMGLDAITRTGGAIIAVLIWRPSAEAMVAGYLAGSFLTIYLLSGKSISNIQSASMTSSGDAAGKSLALEMKKYASPLIPLAALSWVSSLGDRYVISALSNLTETGIYTAALGLISRPFLMMGGALLQTLRPLYFEAVSANDRAKENRMFGACLLGTFGICLIGVSLVFAFKTEIAALLLASSYQKASELFPLIAIGYSFISLSHVFNTASLAHMHSKAVLISETSGGVASILSCIPLVWHFGIIGAAAAVVVYAAVQVAVACWLAWSFISNR